MPDQNVENKNEFEIPKEQNESLKHNEPLFKEQLEQMKQEFIKILTQKEENIIQLENQLNLINIAPGEVNDKLEQLEKNFHNLEQDLNVKIGRYQEVLTGTEESFEELEKKLLQQDPTLKEQSLIIDQLHNDLVEKGLLFQKAMSLARGLEHQNALLVDKLEKQQNLHECQIVQLRTEYDNLLQLQDSIKNDNQALKARNVELSEENKNKGVQISGLEKAIQVLRNELQELNEVKNWNKTIVGKLEVLKKENEQLKQDNLSLNEQVLEYNDTIVDLNNLNKQLINQNESLEYQNQALQLEFSKNNTFKPNSQYNEVRIVRLDSEEQKEKSFENNTLHQEEEFKIETFLHAKLNDLITEREWKGKQLNEAKVHELANSLKAELKKHPELKDYAVKSDIRLKAMMKDFVRTEQKDNLNLHQSLATKYRNMDIFNRGNPRNKESVEKAIAHLQQQTNKSKAQEGQNLPNVYKKKPGKSLS